MGVPDARIRNHRREGVHAETTRKLAPATLKRNIAIWVESGGGGGKGGGAWEGRAAPALPA